MTIQTRCPTCQTTFQVSAAQANKWVCCANCNGTFQARPDTALPQTQAPVPAVVEPDWPAAPQTQEPEPVESDWPVEPLRASEPSQESASQGSGKVVGWVLFFLVMMLIGAIRSATNSGSGSSSVSSPSFDAVEAQRALDSMQQNNINWAERFLKKQEEAEKKAGKPPRSRAVRDAEFLVRQLDDPEKEEAAAKKLSETTTVETIPVLIEAVQSRKVRVRQHCLDVLERLRAPESAEGLARFLATPDGEPAGKVLLAIGPRADPSVRPLLRHAGATIRLRACQILQKIGTRDSLPDLRARLEDINKEVRDAAAAAITAIKTRENGD